ncbi:shikimate dehydrogenase [Orrella sp. NBD-18]|uniref:shikimate dehydrogenase (NADP(+)) n=1 Tax=Sheuella amnicola TaxID=2707330 RepID=A0A6B2QYF9_9BURK|nr:shikimate dehydrogenase [Sheuella amnicola]NDY82159.1 shikimate dehydrogenase [Sheuella amnicola]HBI83538.1 shikimate dehydrogenase [Alcaligenaceae bacterium]
MKEITGKTKLYAIVADPILQVKTPQAINAWISKHDVDGVLVPMHVSASGLKALVEGLRGMINFGGLVVTVPHKTTIIHLCDEVSQAAKMVGAVNIIRRESDGKLHGDILDGKGFVTGLTRHGIEVKDKKVFLAGAGGAANAIAFSLCEAGIRELGVYNRTSPKVEDMFARLSNVYPNIKMTVATASPKGYDLVVNATSLGMAETDSLPLNVDDLVADQIVAEIIMRPALTPLLAAAQAKGCRIQYGLPMLESQIDLMAEFMRVGN